MLDIIGDCGETVVGDFGSKPILRDAPRVFPLLASVCYGANGVPGAKVARPLFEWGERALLESVILGIRL